MGVKSLWSLLSPAGRPVMLETVEGKSMAIDSSIWIYQFQATMRDKDGRGLVNAHVLGFLRRICKLLFYGIKPVFVFDGGAPALKRMTIAERKKKKSGAAESHARIAEKLLAAQMRKDALNHVQSSSGVSTGASRPPQGPVSIDEDTVYLEDLDGSNPTVTPARNTGKAKEASSSSVKKSRWHDHDPYRLPEIDMDATVAKVTRSSAPDPRLATEDELRTFIEMMRPEDLDVNSPAFRELPTEVQYEIIGDLRLRSRQTSHMRLQIMLRNSRTPLDFSRQQIVNLKQRNALTQQLLETTDSIGKANVAIPIRIASERNREYVLIKNEDEVGGWVLGIRDDGTQDKPIVIDNADEYIKSDQESDDDMDMEEVTIPQTTVVDPDLQEHRRELALGAIERRQAAAVARGRPKTAASTKKISPKKEPLFIPDADADEDNIDIEYETESDQEYAEMITAVQESLEDQEAHDLQRALEESRKAGSHTAPGIQSDDSDGDLYVDYTPSRLDTALRFANTGRDTGSSSTGNFPRPSLPVSSLSTQKAVVASDEDDDEDMEEVVVPFQSAISSASQLASSSPPVIESKKIAERVALPDIPSDEGNTAISGTDEGLAHRKRTSSPPVGSPQKLSDSAVVTSIQSAPSRTASITNSNEQTQSVISLLGSQGESEKTLRTTNDVLDVEPLTFSQQNVSESDSKPALTESEQDVHPSAEQSSPESSSEDETWSRPATPRGSGEQEGSAKQHEEGWDAAEEMNVHEETGEFARFAAQVRGRDLDAVRAEIDDEIRQLQQQRKAAMRDSEDINQAMIAQIMTMLRLFGIPYITAPMEAEAQCAALVDLGLVDGVITDDSDVFLFGAKRVYKNMFNQSKTVECFLLTDLSRELGLDRGTLIRLAYLLGSDYTTGLPGVGPVVAMEFLQEFPGDDGLHRFKDWWTKVQSGRDKETDNVSTFRKRFKKRFKDLYLPSDWPNPAVRDAYYHPVVDSSEELFKWGLPDLDGLRSFFHNELSWHAGKVDELLLPIIQKMNKRGQDTASIRQGTLNTFFSVSEGAGAAEPRRREAYASRRLQTLVSAHRKAQKQRAEDNGPESSEEEETQSVKKKRKEVSAVEGSEDARCSRSGKRRRGGVTGNRRGRGVKIPAEKSGEGSAAPSESKQKRTRKSKAKAGTKSTARGTVESDSESSNEFVPKSTPSAAPIREMTLRKRIRPRPAYKGGDSTSINVDGGGDDTELQVNESGSEGSEYQG